MIHGTFSVRLGAEIDMNRTAHRTLATPLSNLAILSSTLAFAHAAHGQQVEFELGVDGSAATSTFEFSIPIAGTLIGDYDARTNPGGTQTRPGLFGGSGNNPIDCDLTVAVAGDGATTIPVGAVAIDLSGIGSSSMVVESLDLDLLDGGVGSVSGELRLLYESFNTVSPFSVYLGGFELPIPLAGAEVSRSEFALVESFPVSTTGKGDSIGFSTLLPVLWTIEFDAGAGTQVQEIPALLPFEGTISGPAGSRSIQFGGTNSNSGSEPLDIPVPAIPLPLPTIPPGDTANLLFEGSVIGVDFATGLDVLVIGAERASSVPGDVNGDGRVNAADIGLVIAGWGLCSDCPADLNGDGIVDSGDLGLVIAGWTG